MNGYAEKTQHDACRQDGVGRALCYQRLIERNDVRGIVGGQWQIVRYHNLGKAALPPSPVQKLPEFPFAAHVNPGGGFVKKEQIGIAHEGRG